MELALRTSRVKVGEWFPGIHTKTIHGRSLSVPNAAAPFLHLQFLRFAGSSVCNLHLRSFVRRDLEIRSVGRNRVFYLVGHLAAMHDRMILLLGLGERLHPELDETYITNPDRVLADPLSATELRRAWAEINNKLTADLERFTLQDWLQKHTAVSDEDFVKDPTRNRLAVVMSRINHASFHSGQAILAKGA